MCYSIETTLKSEIRKLEKVCIYTVYRPAIPLILDTSFFFEVWKKRDESSNREICFKTFYVQTIT